MANPPKANGVLKGRQNGSLNKRKRADGSPEGSRKKTKTATEKREKKDKEVATALNRASKTAASSSKTAASSSQRGGNEETMAEARKFLETANRNPLASSHIYIVRPSNGTSENLGEVMGYIGVNSATELYDLYHKLRAPIRSLQDQAEGRYGYTSSTKTVPLSDIAALVPSLPYGPDQHIQPIDDEFLADPARVAAYIDDAAFEDSLVFPAGAQSGSLRGTVIFIRHAQIIIHQARQLFPHAFPGSHVPNVRDEFCGLIMEDISRVNCLLNFARYRRRQDSKAKGNSDFWHRIKPTDRKHLKLGTEPIAPLFKTDTGPPPPDSAERQAQRHAASIQAWMNEFAKHPELMVVRDPNMSDEDYHKIQNCASNLGLGLGGKASSKKKKKGEQLLKRLAKIDERLMDSVVKNIYAGLNVLFDRDEDVARAAHLAGSTGDKREVASIGQLTGDLGLEASAGKGNVNVEENPADFNEQQRKGLKELKDILLESGRVDVTADSAPSMRELLTKRIIKSFQKFQQSINTISAVAPAYGDAVDQLGYRVQRDDDNTPVASHRSLLLLPHQVVGIAHCVGMLESDLRSALLADETGLGKTIQAVCTHDKINDNIEKFLDERSLLADPESFVDFPPENPLAGGNDDDVDLIDDSLEDDDAASDDSSDDGSDNGDDQADTPPTGAGALDETLEDDPDDSDDDEDIPWARQAYYTPASREKLEAAIKRNDKLREEFDCSGMRYFMPTIVYAPSGTTDVWQDEIRDNFPHLRMKTFLAAGSTNQKKAMGTDFPGSGLDLADYCRSLPIDNRLTGNTIIVTSYTTSAARFLRHWVRTRNGQQFPLSKLTPQEADECNIPRDKYKAQYEYARELKANDGGEEFFELRVPPYTFGLGIWDEVHRLKNINTQQLHTLLHQKHRMILMLSASPIVRRLNDFKTILTIVSNTSRVSALGAGLKDGPLAIDDYEKLRERLQACGGSYLMADPTLQQDLAEALDPMSYNEIMKKHDDSPPIVRRVVPTPYSILALRRVTGQHIEALGENHIIAGNIPPFHCTVVELEPGVREYATYRRAHDVKFGEDEGFRTEKKPAPAPLNPISDPTAPPNDDDGTEVRDNVDKRRRLQTASNNAGLDQFAEFKIDAKAKEVQTWFEAMSGDWASFAFYFISTNMGWSNIPNDRISQAHYITSMSSKMQYCVKEAHRLRKLGKKLLVYADWPVNVWLYKTLFDILGFNAARISAGQSGKDRSAIQKAFNDPNNHEVDILCCSSRSAAESFNFQKGCHNIIITDIVNFNTICQIIGRCFRIGQKYEQFVKILMLNRTYDQVLLANYASAMIAQLAATSGAAMESITDEQCMEELKDPLFYALVEQRRKTTEWSLLGQAREELYDRLLHEKFRHNFGVRSDRDNEHWANARCLDAKLLIPAEKEFYLGCGGAVKAHVEKLFKDHGEPEPTTPVVSKGVAKALEQMQRTQERAARAAEKERKRKLKAEKDERKTTAKQLKDAQKEHRDLIHMQKRGTTGLAAAIKGTQQKIDDLTALVESQTKAQEDTAAAKEAPQSAKQDEVNKNERESPPALPFLAQGNATGFLGPEFMPLKKSRGTKPIFSAAPSTNPQPADATGHEVTLPQRSSQQPATPPTGHSHPPSDDEFGDALDLDMEALDETLSPSTRAHGAGRLGASSVPAPGAVVPSTERPLSLSGTIPAPAEDAPSHLPEPQGVAPVPSSLTPHPDGPDDDELAAAEDAYLRDFAQRTVDGGDLNVTQEEELGVETLRNDKQPTIKEDEEMKDVGGGNDSAVERDEPAGGDTAAHEERRTPVQVVDDSGAEETDDDAQAAESRQSNIKANTVRCRWKVKNQTSATLGRMVKDIGLTAKDIGGKTKEHMTEALMAYYADELADISGSEEDGKAHEEKAPCYPEGLGELMKKYGS